MANGRRGVLAAVCHKKRGRAACASYLMAFYSVEIKSPIEQKSGLQPSRPKTEKPEAACSAQSASLL